MVKIRLVNHCGIRSVIGIVLVLPHVMQTAHASPRADITGDAVLSRLNVSRDDALAVLNVTRDDALSVSNVTREDALSISNVAREDALSLLECYKGCRAFPLKYYKG